MNQVPEMFLCPQLNNTEVYLTPFINSTQNHTIAGKMALL